MPVARLEGHRLRAGTHAASALTSTYNVEDFPVQSDQNDACPWTIDGAGTTPPKPARIVTNGDLSRSPDGEYTWQWRMSYMTNGMLSYWLATFLPGGVESANVTVMTYDKTDTAMFLTAKLWLSDFPGPDAQYANGGWGNVIWRFVAGVQIFP
jgi:hypothetical protein